jgi:3,4-dihydroxy 2-butanone 4-phosphate synthase / GTP cyclohydrolase II
MATPPQNSQMRDAIKAFSVGLPVIVCDDDDREGEADIVMSAQLASPTWIGWTITHSSGLLCAPMSPARADLLGLPAMVKDNRDPRGTAYTVTVDASAGITTGIGARDRTRTLNLLAEPGSTASDFIRPGHVLPLRGHPQGLAGRRGHTEAAIALCELAELAPVGVIAEAVDAHGEPLTRVSGHALAIEHSLPIIDVTQLAAAYSAFVTSRKVSAGAPESRVSRYASATISTRHGDFTAIGYRDSRTRDEHIAMVAGRPTGSDVTVRVHSECLTSESLGSLRCDCAEQLDASLAIIARRGGVLIYLRGHEGRGIGLTSKLAAYRLQDERGLDTVDANLAINAPVDAREYGAAAAILGDLGIPRVRLLTGNPAKVSALTEGGITVADIEPLTGFRTPANSRYLAAKQARLGHVC